MTRAVIETWPDEASQAALALAALIRDEAVERNVGPLTETLKWGEPAFLTDATKAGTTLRIGWKPKAPDELRLLVNCQTNLVDRWRAQFPELTCEGDRAVVLALDAPLPEHALRGCIAMALTYHRDR